MHLICSTNKHCWTKWTARGGADKTRANTVYVFLYRFWAVNGWRSVRKSPIFLVFIFSLETFNLRTCLPQNSSYNCQYDDWKLGQLVINCFFYIGLSNILLIFIEVFFSFHSESSEGSTNWLGIFLFSFKLFMALLDILWYQIQGSPVLL